MSEREPDRPTPAPASDVNPRGEATREALVEAAVELFGHQGYHATSNRSLAQAAGANAALIGYHFGGKWGLYLAAFEHIAERMRNRLGPVVDSIRGDLERLEDQGDKAGAGSADPAEVRERLLPLLLRLLDGFVAMLTAEESASWARLIVREQQDPSEALDIVYRGMLGRVLDLATRLIARIEGVPIPPDGDPAGSGEENGEGGDLTAVRLKVLTVMGQALVFRAARTTSLRHLGWEAIGPEEVALIQRQIRANTTAILEGSTPQGETPR